MAGAASEADGAGARFLPRQAPVDAVQEGGFRFADMSHQGCLMAWPGRTQAWPVARAACDLSPEDLQPILERAESIDILVVGTGKDLAVLPADTLSALREAGLALEVSATRAAVRTYNVLLSEDRRVAAALFALPHAGQSGH